MATELLPWPAAPLQSLLAFYAESAAAALADEAGAEPEAVGAVLAAEAPVDEAA